MGAGSVCSNESFLSSLGVPPPAFQDMIKAHLDKPVLVGLVRCERSVPPQAQAKYDYVHQARQQLGPHEFNWTIMDLGDDPGRPLYQKFKDTHFAAAHQTQAISKLVGKALAALAVDRSSTSTAEVPPGAPPPLLSLVQLSRATARASPSLCVALGMPLATGSTRRCWLPGIWWML